MLDVELQLENPLSSRTTGAFVHEGELYIPCDLGYIWRRVPDDSARLVLRILWAFKNWHLNVLEQGAVVLRADGVRYPLNAVLVEDETLLIPLRARVESAASEFFGGLLPVATDPADIWFFRLDNR